MCFIRKNVDPTNEEGSVIYLRIDRGTVETILPGVGTVPCDRFESRQIIENSPIYTYTLETYCMYEC